MIKFLLRLEAFPGEGGEGGCGGGGEGFHLDRHLALDHHRRPALSCQDGGRGMHLERRASLGEEACPLVVGRLQEEGGSACQGAFQGGACPGEKAFQGGGGGGA